MQKCSKIKTGNLFRFQKRKRDGTRLEWRWILFNTVHPNLTKADPDTAALWIYFSDKRSFASSFIYQSTYMPIKPNCPDNLAVASTLLGAENKPLNKREVTSLLMLHIQLLTDFVTNADNVVVSRWKLFCATQTMKRQCTCVVNCINRCDIPGEFCLFLISPGTLRL